MSTKIKRLIVIMISASLIPLIWGAGWILFDELAIWETLTNIQYQNVLFILIGLESVLLYAGAYKIKQPLSNFDKKYLNKMFKKAVSKIEPEVQKHDERLTQIERDVADLKVADSLKPTEDK